MMIEGSGSGSIPLTKGSGSERPKNTWIRNTAELTPNWNLTTVEALICRLTTFYGSNSHKTSVMTTTWGVIQFRLQPGNWLQFSFQPDTWLRFRYYLKCEANLRLLHDQRHQAR
jgi:hypothetical protein